MNKEDLKELKEKISLLSEAELKQRDLYLRSLSTGELQGPCVGYPSIDRPWLKYYPEEGIIKDIPDVSMFQYFVNCCKNRMNLTAIDLRMSFNNFDKAVRKMTYGDFIDEVITISCGFLAYGFKSDEVFIEVLPNLIESRESIYAANAIGTCVYPISPMLPTKKFAEIIQNNDVKNIAIFGEFYDKFSECLKDNKIENIFLINGLESFDFIKKKVALFGNKIKKSNKFNIPNDSRIVTWHKLLQAGKSYRKAHNIKDIGDFKPYYSKNHIAVIVGTSGTTGVPKGACIRDMSINACDFSEQIPKPFEPGEINLDILIQSISYGLGIMHHTMCGGLYNIVIPEMITDKIGLILKKFKPDHFSGGPIHYENILRSKEYHNGELKTPKNYLSGGATLAKKTEIALNNNVDSSYVEPLNGYSKIFVRQGLGSTENIGTGIFTTRGSYKFGSVGIPIALSNCSIFENGTQNELSYNQTGEICMTGETVMKEYLNNPSETEKVLKLHNDGKIWLHLGDEGYIDQEGHVFITDRFKNIFMRNGFNVHPSKIKEVILNEEFVDDCCVLGVEHPVEMYVPVAFIVLKNKNIEANSVISILNQKCYEELDEYFIPYDYIFVEELPYNLGGKVDEHKLLKDSKIDYSENSERKLDLR